MLKLENVSKYYRSNDTVALGLRRVNVELNIGEFIAVTGESGSGKSTLLNVISGLDTYEEGELYINGDETSYYSIEDWENYRRQYIGFVFQNYNIIDSYSVLENVMVALKLQGYDKETRRQRALELIDQVGLTSHTHHKASKLSGGQKQRAVIARALAKDCPIIVCDEPTGNLDTESSRTVIELLKEISKDKLVIIVTHNYEEVSEYATRRIRLFDGQVIEDKQLKKVVKSDKKVEVAPYYVNMWGLFTLALRNLFRTPRRTIFTAVIFLFIVLVFTFTYGNYVNIINEEINDNWNSTFRNVNENRIIVTKYDYTPFTEDDLEELGALKDTVYLNLHDVVNDTAVLVYRYNEDYQYVEQNNYYINPAVVLLENELKSGRLPDNKFEVVAEEISGYRVGDKILMSIIDQSIDWESTEEDLEAVTEEYTVVGITAARNRYWSEQLYFHQDFIEDPAVVQKAYVFNEQINVVQILLSTIELEEYNEYEYDERILQLYGYIEIDNTLDDFEININHNILNDLKWRYAELNGIEYDNVTNQQIYDWDLNMYKYSSFEFYEFDVKIGGYNTETVSYYGVNKMNQTTFDTLFETEVYQVSVHVVDKFDANKVIEEIEELGYNSIYPSNTETAYDQLSRIILGLLYGFFMVLLMFGMYFIVYLILKNIQLSKKKDYLIFRSIGASKSNLNKVTIIELLITMIVSYIIVYILLQFQARYGFIPYIGNILKYFTVSNYLFLTALLFYLAYILGARFNKKIFNNSVITALKAE